MKRIIKEAMKRNTIISPAVKRFSMLLLAGWTIAGLTANAQTASVTPQPAAVEVPVGETFEVIMHVDPAGQSLAVADLHLRFNTSYLEVIQVEALSAPGFNVMPASFNNAEGTVDLSAFQLGDVNIAPAFDLLKVTFRALAETELTSVSHPQSIFPRTILAFAGAELSTTTQPVDVVITGAGALSTLDADTNGMSLGVWPNPTNGVSFATFSTRTSGTATVELFDISGKRMATIFHGTTAPGAEQRVEMNLSKLADGLYMCRLITEYGTIVKRLAVNR